MDLSIFFAQQLEDWPLAASNFEKLNLIETKSFDFDGYKLYAHFNPARAVSSLAKLDLKSIQARPCFLCAHNRPKEEGAIEYKNRYDILVNPYPICPTHFIVADKEHVTQCMTETYRIADFIDLAKDLPNLVCLFNGAKAGASAPDHFHFQAVNKDFFKESIHQEMPGLISKTTFTFTEKQAGIDLLKKVYTSLNEANSNLFCTYEHGEWTITIFPRKKHRSHHFFEENEKQLLVSPGAIDMTGNLIVSRKEDFDKLNKELMIEIYTEVSGQ